MAATETRMIETERGRFNVRLAGAETGPVIVMVHGWPESSYCWQGVAAHLPDHYRLIMPDLRGLGDSERTLDDAAYTKQALAADMLGLLDTLGVETFNLVGHDWGGAVAQEMALAAPERVHRLVILNIHVITNARGNAAAQAQLRNSGGRSFWYQFFQTEPHLPEAMIPGNEEVWLGHFLKTWTREAFPAAAFEEYVRCYAIAHTPATGAAYYRCYKPDTARWAEIAGTRFAMPGLYIYGQHDPVIIEPFTRHLDDVFDDIRLETLDAAHFVQEERPREVAALIAEFVGQNDHDMKGA
jgi:pimeloyl-ACP methyl ester carboxylesterase